MHEHRLIERMIAMLDKEAERLENGENPDLPFLFNAIEFIRVYADMLHHGKEEDVLFRELENKDLSDEHEAMRKELIEDHKHGRRLVAELEDAAAAFSGNGDAKAVAGILRKLAAFYPDHIEKEDKHFFFPVLEYFDDEEKRNMLEEYETLEKSLIGERYKALVEKYENKRA
ncbi:MAG: hemerythrin domain-containing protein [Oceanidesulfovibrio sp.]